MSRRWVDPLPLPATLAGLLCLLAAGTPGQDRTPSEDIKRGPTTPICGAC